MKGPKELLGSMDKTKWMILGLCGALLLVIALPVEKDGNEDLSRSLEAESARTQEDSGGTYRAELEQELEQKLSCMEGVGNVQVMLTFQDNGSQVVEKDVTRSQSAEGTGEDGRQDTQYQETTVYQEETGKEPYVSRTELPAIEGVLIVAEGGDDSLVKRNITEAVQALFPVEAHKIKVVRMRSGSP